MYEGLEKYSLFESRIVVDTSENTKSVENSIIQQTIYTSTKAKILYLKIR